MNQWIPVDKWIHVNKEILATKEILVNKEKLGSLGTLVGHVNLAIHKNDGIDAISLSHLSTTSFNVFGKIRRQKKNWVTNECTTLLLVRKFILSFFNSMFMLIFHLFWPQAFSSVSSNHEYLMMFLIWQRGRENEI